MCPFRKSNILSSIAFILMKRKQLNLFVSANPFLLILSTLHACLKINFPLKTFLLVSNRFFLYLIEQINLVSFFRHMNFITVFIYYLQLMRRSMKRLKTFKQIRRSEGSSIDGNSIPLEDIGGKKKFFQVLYSMFLVFVLSFNFFFFFPLYMHVHYHVSTP